MFHPISHSHTSTLEPCEYNIRMNKHHYSLGLASWQQEFRSESQNAYGAKKVSIYKEAH